MSLCDACGQEHEYTTTCQRCGAVLCDECFSQMNCPGDKVIGTEAHVAPEEK